MRDLRGRGHAFPFPADGAATLSAEQRHSMNGTGFRLAHDEVGRVYRGGSWIFPADLAGEENRYWSFPTVASPMLGIRMVADWKVK